MVCGLGAILATSETLFFIVKIIGALYLMYLGWNTWKNSSIQLDGDTATTDKCVPYSSYALFRKGFMVGISNPKDLLFFIALFPSFMSPDVSQIEQYAILASTWFVLDCASMFIFLGSALAVSAGVSKKIL